MDHGNVVFDFKERAHKFYYRSHGDLAPSMNQLDFGYELTKYHPRLEKSCDNTRAGWLYRYHKSQSLYYFQHTFKPIRGWQPVFRYSQGVR